MWPWIQWGSLIRIASFHKGGSRCFTLIVDDEPTPSPITERRWVWWNERSGEIFSPDINAPEETASFDSWTNFWNMVVQCLIATGFGCVKACSRLLGWLILFACCLVPTAGTTGQVLGEVEFDGLKGSFESEQTSSSGWTYIYVASILLLLTGLSCGFWERPWRESLGRFALNKRFWHVSRIRNAFGLLVRISRCSLLMHKKVRMICF